MYCMMAIFCETLSISQGPRRICPYLYIAYTVLGETEAYQD